MAAAAKRRKQSKPAKKGRCLTCQNKAQSRGLCWSCLSSAKSAMRNGDKTEAELIELKMILPSMRAGRPISTGFARRLAEVK